MLTSVIFDPFPLDGMSYLAFEISFSQWFDQGLLKYREGKLRIGGKISVGQWCFARRVPQSASIEMRMV